MNLAYRVGRGSPLSYEELDGNFQQLEAGVNASEKLPLIVPIEDFGALLGGPEGYPLGRFKLPDANAGYYIGVVVERLYLSSNFYIRSTLPSGLVVVHAWVDDALEDVTVYSTVRANHTGTQPLSSIADKQGQVANDFFRISYADVDTAVNKGLYEFTDGGYVSFAYGRVTQDPLTLQPAQTLVAPLSGVILTRYMVDGAWTAGIASLNENTGLSKSIYDPAGVNSDVFNRANHHGSQAVSTVDGLQTALDSKAGRVIVTPPITTSSKIFTPLDDATLTPFTATGAKTALFNAASSFTANQEISITNLAASGDLTIIPTGITMTPPKRGTLVLEPQDTVTVKFHTDTVAQVIGSTKAAV
jgi:hypothetical protein